MSETLRTFIAIELPAATVAAIQGVQEELKSGKLRLKWVRPASIHLTLKFLGDVTREDLAKIKPAMVDAASAVAPFSLTARGMGVFPTIKNPRVLWIGIAGELASLGRLQQCLEAALADIGFPVEKRPFKAHLTLARAKGRIDPAALNQLVAQCGGFECEPFTAREIVLFRSELRPQGAVYTKLEIVPLSSDR